MTGYCWIHPMNMSQMALIKIPQILIYSLQLDRLVGLHLTDICPAAWILQRVRVFAFTTAS